MGCTHEENGKHGKFDYLWKGPYKIVAFRGKNAYILEEMEGGLVLGGLVNTISLYIPFYFNIACVDSSME